VGILPKEGNPSRTRLKNHFSNLPRQNEGLLHRSAKKGTNTKSIETMGGDYMYLRFYRESVSNTFEEIFNAGEKVRGKGRLRNFPSTGFKETLLQERL